MPAKKPTTAQLPASNAPSQDSSLPVAAARAPRRHFEAAHKLRIARMIREDGLSLTQVCRDHNLTPSAVRRWVV